MVPLILDTGASVTITPFCSDFVTPLQPVQHITIKGIASGLKAEGVGDVSYTFVNDSGNEQTLTLQNCLYVPQCVVRLICPRQIGASTGVSDDGFYASHQQSVLIVNGQRTTVKYETLSQLPLLYTKPGIRSFLAFQDSFMAASATAVSTVPIGDNLSKSQ
jgi:hypothetical protein